jgi:F-box-like
METLPTEVWVQVIQQALPMLDYARELLSLTMVSKKWQYNLLSAPILWANIQLRGSEEDSLAIVEISPMIQPSR